MYKCLKGHAANGHETQRQELRQGYKRPLLFPSSSPSLKIFFMCLLIPLRSLLNNSAICACVSHTVPLSA